MAIYHTLQFNKIYLLFVYLFVVYLQFTKSVFTFILEESLEVLISTLTRSLHVCFTLIITNK